MKSRNNALLVPVSVLKTSVLMLSVCAVSVAKGCYTHTYTIVLSCHIHPLVTIQEQSNEMSPS